MVFLLSRSSFRIHRMPRVYEEIVVSTWEHGIKGSQFLRDFEYFSKEGELLVSASTAWLLVNPVSRKILRPTEFIGELQKLPEKKPDCMEAGKRGAGAARVLGKRKYDIRIWTETATFTMRYTGILSLIFCRRI